MHGRNIISAMEDNFDRSSRRDESRRDPASRRKLRKVRKTGDEHRGRDRRLAETGEETPTFRRIVSRHDRRSREVDEAREMLREGAGEAPENALAGIVTEIVPGGCIVRSDSLELRCVLRGMLKSLETRERNVVAVGDHVLFVALEDGSGVIERVQPRDTILSRKYKEREHVVAVNVEQLLVTVSVAAPPIRTGLIDRYLVAAENGGLRAIIVVNKLDLADAEERESLRSMLNVYSEIGYAVVYCSASSGEGLDDLRAVLRDKTSIFSGQSGVGKSSLLNALQPGLELRVGEVSELTRKGIHTTTTIKLLPLDIGGFVVDTPGIREFALWDVSRQDLPHFFPEFAEFLGKCRLRGCTHTHEPGCEVKKALEEGRINIERYESYCRMIESLEG